MPVHQLIYSSRYKPGPATASRPKVLDAILITSRRNNERDGLTGFLLFDQTWFFQILEGEHEPVLTRYSRIQRDPRHQAVQLMALRRVAQRTFPEWSMGGALRSPEQQAIFLRHGISDVLDPSKVVAPTILALAMDLQDYEIAQRQGAPATA